MLTLPPLPYRDTSLEPEILYVFVPLWKAPQYVDNLNQLIAGTEYEHPSFENIITDKVGLFNNGGGKHTADRHGVR